MQDPELKIELKIGMGGGLLNELVDRMTLKIKCLDMTKNTNNTNNECKDLQELKMYTYSSVSFFLPINCLIMILIYIARYYDFGTVRCVRHGICGCR